MENYIKDPITYFINNVFLESLLISFEYVADTVTVVSDYAYDRMYAVSTSKRDNSREFRKLFFTGVSNYKRQLGERKDLKDTGIDFFAKEYTGGHLIQDLKIIPLDERYYIDIWFGESLGGLSFSFTSLLIYKRLGIAKKNICGEFDYYDKNTSQQFDFYKPF